MEVLKWIGDHPCRNVGGTRWRRRCHRQPINDYLDNNCESTKRNPRAYIYTPALIHAHARTHMDPRACANSALQSRLFDRRRRRISRRGNNDSLRRIRHMRFRRSASVYRRWRCRKMTTASLRSVRTDGRTGRRSRVAITSTRRVWSAAAPNAEDSFHATEYATRRRYETRPDGRLRKKTKQRKNAAAV